MTKVKICGITDLEDALHAVECGADALGFNFHRPSPRYLTPETAASIIGRLPSSVECVGVFVNKAVEQIHSIAVSCGLTMLQLHGEETADHVIDCSARTQLPVIKAFRVGPQFRPQDVTKYIVDSILLDAYCADAAGGTGELCDWQTAAMVRPMTPQLYLAGGLSPDNVAEAVEKVRPYAVDACSLLETTPGKKDHGKVAAFIAAAKKTL